MRFNSGFKGLIPFPALQKQLCFDNDSEFETRDFTVCRLSFWTENIIIFIISSLHLKILFMASFSV